MAISSKPLIPIKINRSLPVEIKVAKANHKQALKNKSKYIKDRDNLVRRILSSYTPNWGALRVTLIKW